MSRNSRDEYLEKQRERYARMSGKPARSKLLNEFCEVTGHERKYAIKLLAGMRRKDPKKTLRGRPSKYGEPEKAVIRTIWKACEQPCGKRLKAALSEWLPAYEKRYGELDETVRGKVISISPAQIDRLLATEKVSPGVRYRPGLKANAAVKAHIPIRAETWNVSEPGWSEADTVALCGGSMAGDFAWALTVTDIATGWTEARATWNRGQHGVCEAFRAIEAALPFALKGVDTDNGGEFLNWHLVSHFANREVKVEQTRSRPYHKNDQAYVEQKNYTHVRALLGYDRIGHAEVVDSLNGLLAYWSLWNNLYSPTMRQIERRREKGGRVVRRHEKRPKTPCQRVLEGELDPGIRGTLERLRESIDPFAAKEHIETGLREIWDLVKVMNRAEADGEDPSTVAAARHCPGLRYAPSGAMPRAPFGRTSPPFEKPLSDQNNQPKTTKTVPPSNNRKPAA
jgi:hypothetical protein